ncbi:hypothetical protein [Sphingomonas sp. PAMC 26605]|uniref:hypothetical protein n=1 Tax=Sphingomonas sp. PAMC 26605 TaxID=1112214 RepID=UPI00026CDCBF|nr:hypothetical protein [Sphingomonas sp. PAMC 26605]
MLKLGEVDPVWKELFPANGDTPAVRVQFKPIGIKALRAARRAIAAALGVDPDDIENAGDELSRELIRAGLIAWEGIGDLDDNVIEVTPETIEMFIADPRTFEAADRVYVTPWVMQDLEKNGSSASPVGTGVAETPAKDTAGSSAPRAKKAAATSARTPKMSRKPKPAPASGS